MSIQKSDGLSSAVHRSVSLNESERNHDKQRENENLDYTRLKSNPGM